MRISTLLRFGSSTLACLGAALLLSSCAEKPQDALIGKWNVEENQSVVEYRKDGTMVTSQNGQDTPGKYKFVDNSHFEMEVTGTQGTNKLSLVLTCEVAIHGDKAEVSATLPGHGAGGSAVTKTLHYTRVK